jgi:hypothetical protein
MVVEKLKCSAILMSILLLHYGNSVTRFIAGPLLRAYKAGKESNTVIDLFFSKDLSRCLSEREGISRECASAGALYEHRRNYMGACAASARYIKEAVFDASPAIKVKRYSYSDAVITANNVQIFSMNIYALIV